MTLRVDKAKISVFKSDLVDLEERGILNLVTTLDETVYSCSGALTATLLHLRVKLPASPKVPRHLLHHHISLFAIIAQLDYLKQEFLFTVFSCDFHQQWLLVEYINLGFVLQYSCVLLLSASTHPIIVGRWLCTYTFPNSQLKMYKNWIIPKSSEGCRFILYSHILFFPHNQS